MIHRGQRVTLGGVQEILRHYDYQWHAYLELLINNPTLPNPFEQYKDNQDADLRQGLKDRGYIGMSQAQILAKRDAYISTIEAGEPPYNDRELYRACFLNDNGEIIDSQTGEVIPFVPVVPGS